MQEQTLHARERQEHAPQLGGEGEFKHAKIHIIVCPCCSIDVFLQQFCFVCQILKDCLKEYHRCKHVIFSPSNGTPPGLPAPLKGMLFYFRLKEISSFVWATWEPLKQLGKLAAARWVLHPRDGPLGALGFPGCTGHWGRDRS